MSTELTEDYDLAVAIVKRLNAIAEGLTIRLE